MPAIRHGEALVTEQVAIYIYLADLFPEAGLTPALDDPSRGPICAGSPIMVRPSSLP